MSRMLVGYYLSRRFATTLTPRVITQLLSANEASLDRTHEALIPSQIRSIECNQLAANNPIEDRLRISSVRLPGSREPTLILGVFDGHGGGTTANLISRRLFNYIAISLHPSPGNLEISSTTDPRDRKTERTLVDLHQSPQPSGNSHLLANELDMLNYYKSELSAHRRESATRPSPLGPMDVAANLRASFRRCDDDLSQEIQQHLMNPSSLDQHALRHYLSASVSGCCAIVMVIHEGTAYLASSGDCRAVLGVYDGEHEVEAGSPDQTALGTARGRPDSSQSTRPPGGLLPNHLRYDELTPPPSPPPQASSQIECPKASSLRALELNDEHNCDNINEIRRLTAAHPRSEQNTMIKHNRLLGHLMPFRAFGDFTYKWPADIIRACGITRAFGPGVIPASYESPPYLIVEPDVRVLSLSGVYDETDLQPEARGQEKLENHRRQIEGASGAHQRRYLVMASDGLWELFESSRDVIEAIVDHSLNSRVQGYEEDYDANCATYVLRSALRSGPHQDIGMDRERMRRLNHLRLESTLTLPKSVVRNYRDDISLILMKLA